jgi:pimeloyl-ACP methyl ester carboxylesterase
LGIIPLGTSLDTESPRALALGCWDALGPLAHLITTDFGVPNPEFTLPDTFITFLVDSGFGPKCPEDVRAFWTKECKNNYAGEEGRKRVRMAAINLRDRDGLHLRAGDVRCPVLWMHGTDDAVYSVANAKEEIEMFTGAKEKKLEVVQGGQHFLSASNPEEVGRAVGEFVERHWKAGEKL